MKETYSVGELVKELNINKETIRYYEKLGLLSKPKKNKNGYRIYSKEDIELIRAILIIKKIGFSLKEIKMLIQDEILCGDIENIKRIVDSKLNEIDKKINDLELTKRLLNKVNVNILSKNIESCSEVEIYLKNNLDCVP